MQHLLVPIDALSAERTQTAVAEAIARSRLQPVHVHLASVQPPVSGHVALFFAESELHGLQEETGQNEMAGARALLEAAGVAYTPHVRVGRRAEAIAALARELHCDTILMGQDANPGPVGRLFGSVAGQVRHLLDTRPGSFQVIGS
ncbi:universal stress protein [Ramlibacter sp. MAHUQ-53]|uniref:universal stress protein n=1 Tax=unclassified Ramlibacter TaxID=2617605 RepID=UPI00362F9C91